MIVRDGDCGGFAPGELSRRIFSNAGLCLDQGKPRSNFLMTTQIAEQPNQCQLRTGHRIDPQLDALAPFAEVDQSYFVAIDFSEVLSIDVPQPVIGSLMPRQQHYEFRLRRQWSPDEARLERNYDLGATGSLEIARTGRIRGEDQTRHVSSPAIHKTKTGTGDVGNSTSSAPADAGPYVVRQIMIRCIGS